MALATTGLGMRFGQRWVLRDVSIEFEPGHVHGLVGHNGSGKSTLIKILSGYHAPTEGAVTLDDQRMSGRPPGVIYESGIRFVHQDLGLIPEFTALENLGVGGSYSTTRLRSIDWNEQVRRLQNQLAAFEIDLPLDVPVGRLPAVDRSLIAIARAVESQTGDRGSTRYLVLDEPTTALEEPEIEHLFGVIQKLCRSGIGVLYVSHNLSDVLALSTSITVLRDGMCIRTFTDRSASHDSLIRAMLGDASPIAEQSATVGPQSPAVPRPDRRSGSSHLQLSVRNLRSALLRGVDVDLGVKECVCVMGLSGSGREQLAYALAGAIDTRVDSVAIAGQTVKPLRPHTCLEHRVALVPGNRMPGSSISQFTVRENLSLVSLRRHGRRFGWLSRSSEKQVARSWMERFDIRPDDPEYSTRNLSGGNKQKVILAKWMQTDPLILLADEPTAGVDVHAAEKIYSELRRFVDDGGSLLVTTSEAVDTLALADRVLILDGGRISRELVKGRDDITEESLLKAMNQTFRRGSERLRTSAEVHK